MKWILMGIGYIIVDVHTWHLPTLDFLLTQVGCCILFVSGSFPNDGSV